MRVYKGLIFMIFLCLAMAVSVSAQLITTEKKIYQNIVIEKFTFHEDSDFPVDKIDDLTKSVLNTLTKSNRFNSVIIGVDSTSTDQVDVPTLKITGKVLKFVKGSRTTRYVVGGGAGATKIIVDLKFTDVKTGEAIYDQTIEGDVSEGFFGGDSAAAKNEVAEEIIRVMKKNGWAGDKIKKTK